MSILLRPAIPKYKDIKRGVGNLFRTSISEIYKSVHFDNPFEIHETSGSSKDHPRDSKPPKNHAWVCEILARHKIQQFNEFKTLILTD